MSDKVRLRIAVAAGVVVLTAPVWTVNLAVACLGHSVVFPLSPFFLRQKAAALVAYARHRPGCLWHGHADTDAAVRRAEARVHLPPGLLAAVVHVESRGFPHRISAAGAMGPGQLMPDTARQLKVADPFDTVENVEGAAQLLSSHLHRFGNVRFAVAAYNAGPGSVRGRIPQNGETPTYVVKVMRAYAALRPPPARRHPGPGRPPVERAPDRRRLIVVATADSPPAGPALVGPRR